MFKHVHISATILKMIIPDQTKQTYRQSTYDSI